LRSNREKKKPKAEKNKKKSAPVPSVFERVRMIGKDASGKEVLVAQSASIPPRKVRSDELIRAFRSRLYVVMATACIAAR
jgi:hypothetical protein